MNITDIIALALRNLRQAKLRTALTVIGVVVGVAAIITMVSLGIGLQQNIIGNALSKLDLFTKITVWGTSTDELLAMNNGRTAFDEGEAETDASEGDGGKAGKGEKSEANPAAAASPSPTPRVLDDEAVAEIQRLKGVKYVWPNVSFSSFARYNNRTRRLFITGAPASITGNPAFKKFLAGGYFTSPDAPEAIVTENLLTQFSDQWYRERRGRRNNRGGGGPFNSGPAKSEAERAQDARQAMGKEIVLLTLRAADAAPTSIFGIPLLSSSAAATGDGAQELGDGRFERHSFRIVGVLPSERGPNLNFSFVSNQMLVPIDQAKRFHETNRDPMSQLGEALTGESGYGVAEVRVIDPTQVQPVEEQLEKLGLRAFSITTQLDEIKRVFLIVDSSLALIGGIALLVASFGISNTMIMSIRERTREIGIMKAIGGSDGEIMRIFFFEASLIGLAGGALGVISGWMIDRVANSLANKYIVKQATRIEFFSIPWYLWGGAIAFAVLVSLVAAIYPALRAAKVDPIKALRHE